MSQHLITLRSTVREDLVRVIPPALLEAEIDRTVLKELCAQTAQAIVTLQAQVEYGSAETQRRLIPKAARLSLLLGKILEERLTQNPVIEQEIDL